MGNFRANDIEKATTAKFQVEQKQRVEAKERKDTNSDWNNKVSFMFDSFGALSISYFFSTVFQSRWRILGLQESIKP
jgi:hypothetical protein